MVLYILQICRVHYKIRLSSYTHSSLNTLFFCFVLLLLGLPCLPNHATFHRLRSDGKLKYLYITCYIICFMQAEFTNTVYSSIKTSTLYSLFCVSLQRINTILNWMIFEWSSIDARLKRLKQDLFRSLQFPLLTSLLQQCINLVWRLFWC